MGAFGLTEPAAGSDAGGTKTTAVREGNSWILNGTKIFITNGQLADLVIVAAKTDPSQGARGVSLVVIEREDAGFARGRNLDKVGWHAQDTSELFFEDVRIPGDRLLGQEGKGFRYLMQELAQERLLSCLRSSAALEAMLEATIDYVNERKSFGAPLIEHQSVRHRLAAIKTDAAVCRIFVDRLLALHMEGKLDATDAAMGKYHVTETVFKRLDDCMQLHGGYGYMTEYPVARAWADNRVNRIAGGTSEIMQEIIGRSMIRES